MRRTLTFLAVLSVLAPAPTWMTDGVPRLDMEDHLKERANLKKSAAEGEKEKAAKAGEKKK